MSETKHHHHFYDANDLPSVLEHDHEYEDISHVGRDFPQNFTIYWDHSGTDCDAGWFEQESG